MTNIDHLVALVAAAPNCPKWFMPSIPSMPIDAIKEDWESDWEPMAGHAWQTAQISQWPLHWAKEQLKAIQAYTQAANPMIAESMVGGESTTGLCTVREFAESIMVSGMSVCPTDHGFVPATDKLQIRSPVWKWGELAFKHNGKQYNVEMVVTRVTDVGTRKVPPMDQPYDLHVWDQTLTAIRWIPITEQEPPKDVRILVWAADQCVHEAVWALNYGWMSSSISHCQSIPAGVPYEFSHWMPLPPPPVKP